VISGHLQCRACGGGKYIYIERGLYAPAAAFENKGGGHARAFSPAGFLKAAPRTAPRLVFFRKDFFQPYYFTSASILIPNFA
jgi:hypothetical protein